MFFVLVVVNVEEITERERERQRQRRELFVCEGEREGRLEKFINGCSSEELSIYESHWEVLTAGALDVSTSYRY